MNDREAEFRDFVGTEMAQLRGLAYLTCGDWQAAEDAVLTVLARLYVKWNRVDRPASYARTAVVRAAIDETRRPWWRREQSHSHAMPDPDMPDRTHAIDDRLHIRAALRHLPPKLRAVVVLPQTITGPGPDEMTPAGRSATLHYPKADFAGSPDTGLMLPMGALSFVRLIDGVPDRVNEAPVQNEAIQLTVYPLGRNTYSIPSGRPADEPFCVGANACYRLTADGKYEIEISGARPDEDLLTILAGTTVADLTDRATWFDGTEAVG